MKLLISFLTATVLTVACQKDAQVPVRLEPNLPIVSQSEFPIVSWSGIKENETYKFKPMLECGMNVHMGVYPTINDVRHVLDEAQKYGVKLIVSSENFQTNTADEVKAIKDHPALFMYHVDDEPWDNDFDWIARMIRDIRTVDKEHPCYINLYPNWAWGGPGGYRNKVLSYYNAMPEVSFLSFDNYPITSKGLRPDWYRNLEDIRFVSRLKKVPFWAFALALSHQLDENVFYPVPTIAELRLQQFSNLAYGAQGFQYFTFWGVYHDSPTVVYNMVKTINKELQALARYFKDADVMNVWHTGKDIPDGTVKLSALPDGVKSLETSGGAIVSYFKKDGNFYLAVVNKDYKKSMTMDIAFNNKSKKLDKQGRYTYLTSESMYIQPGDIAVFQIL